MFKRFIAILLCMGMLLGLPLTATGEETAALPQVGDMISGFKTLSIEPTDVLGATGVMFEHEKSGAHLLYYATADTNRSFDITFRTPALDEKGKPHVFEHITICGSQKYPDANLFFPVANQTYNTFVNALTYQGMTSFPVASLSEDQLMTLMDYYLSGVFNPLLYDEARLKEREAWRYELSDRDAPLQIAGTVYSEMQGAQTIQRYAAINNLRALFHDSPVAHDSGGLPEAVRTLTYEELVAFHDTYYHPSNALIVLYGDLDLERFLGYIDSEYLSAYERRDVYVEVGRIEPYTETRYETYEAPVEQGAQTEDASYIYYSFAMDGATLYDYIGASLLTSLLNTETLPFLRAAREKMPNANVSVSADVDSPWPQINFVATGVNESDRDTFVSLVDESIAQLATDGIPRDELDALLAMNKLSLMLTAENQSLGVNASLNAAICWARFGDVNFYNTYEKLFNDVDQAYLDEMLDKMLLNNKYRAVSVTKPVAGLAEENEKALSDELAQIKAAMTEEEIDTLLAQYAEFTEWSGRAPSQEFVSQIVNITVDKLPEEVQRFDVADETVDGVRYLTAKADIADVAQAQVSLDASTIPLDKLHDVQTCLFLMGMLDTDEHTKEELDVLMLRYLTGLDMSLGGIVGYEGVPDRYSVSFSWLGLAEDSAKAVELVGEILQKTRFDNADDIRSLLTRSRNSIRDMLDQDPLSIQLSRCYATVSDARAFNEYCGGVTYYRYLEEMLALLDTDPEAFTARMEAARALVLNKHGAMVLIAGGEGALDAYRALLPTLLTDMADEQREKADHASLRLDIASEVLINNMNVHMNIIFGKNDAEYSGKHAVISALIDDMYLLPQLRNMYGAYGAYSGFGRLSSTLYTYRDPNCVQSFDIFAQLPEFLRTAEITQEMVDRYIIGQYSGLSMPQGPLSGAQSAISNLLTGITDDMRLELQREAKATTVDDVRAFADQVQALVENGMRSTSGAASFAQEVADQFEGVVRYDEAESAPETEALDDAA